MESYEETPRSLEKIRAGDTAPRNKRARSVESGRGPKSFRSDPVIWRIVGRRQSTGTRRGHAIPCHPPRNFPCPVKRPSCNRPGTVPPILAHGLAPHVDSMRIVFQSVEDAIGQCRIADLFMPARD
jgi:hypothetical protein